MAGPLDFCDFVVTTAGITADDVVALSHMTSIFWNIGRLTRKAATPDPYCS